MKVYVTNITAKETPTDLFESFDKFQDFKDHIEKLFIEHKLKKHNWNVSKTAEVLDIQRSHLYNKIEKFELRRTDLVCSIDMLLLSLCRLWNTFAISALSPTLTMENLPWQIG